MTPFLFRQTARGDDRLNFAEYRIGSRLDVAVDMAGVLGIGMRRAGHDEALSNGRPIDPTGYFLLHPRDAQSNSVGLEMTMINLDHDAIAELISGEKQAGSRLRLDILAGVACARRVVGGS